MTRDELFRTLKRAVAGSFEVLAELGRGQGGRNAYVAREVDGGGLVVLELNLEDTDPDGTPNYGLFIRRELDASIPALSLQCDQCGASIGGWARYCPNCDRDLSGAAHTTGGRTAAELLESGQLAGHDRYEFLGEMSRAEGGGAVYFARERASGRLVALRVEKEGSGSDAGYKLTTTQTMAALPQAGAAPTPPQQPKVAWRGAEQRSGAGPTGASPGGGVSPATAPGVVAKPGGTAAAESPAAKTGTGGFCPICGASYAAGVWFCPRDGSPIKSAATTDKLIGQTIAGRFHVQRKLGSGGMGTVYLAEHVRMGRPCALKIMNPSLKDDSEALGRFAREAAHASRITHPNVAAIYDFGEADDGTVYLAMEYADGESLGALMKREGAIAPERATEIIGQVLDGLAAAHGIGIVHRDLKPDNIILASTPTGKHAVKVVDFGIAKAMQATESQQLTRTGFVVGTPRYMSPEQITGGTIDGRTDLYSADCILYELLVGSVPFSGPSGEITITRRLTEPPPHPRKLNRTVDRRLDRVVVRAMARDPDNRYRTAEEFRAALNEATRTDFTGAWAKRWEAAVRATSGLAAGAAGALSRAGRGGLAGLGALARGAGSAATAGGAGVAGALRAAAAASGAGARGLGRTLRPLLSWKVAAAVAVLAALSAGGPAVVKWLATPAIEREPPDSAAAGAMTASESGGLTDQPPGDAAAGTARPVTGTATAPALEEPLPQAAATPLERSQAAPGAAPGAVRAQDAVAEPPARPLPAAALDSLRNKLRLANFFAEREEYPDAFDQLRLVRSRLDALRAEFPTAAPLRVIRQEHASALSSITAQCEAIRRVAIGRGEAAPVCR